jgi:DNA-binding SARP family transcriptional activator
VIQEVPGAPSLAVYCLGLFRVYQDEHPVEDWPSSKGKCIFKYLVTHRERPIAKQVLMELFWPGAHPDAARNSLNVAIYGLRQALRRVRPLYSHVLFQDDCYLLNPGLQIWVDCEAFAEHLTTAQALEQRGERVAAMRQYAAAEALYQGEFLEEDRYEDWPIPRRQSLQDDYLGLLEQSSHYYLDQEDFAACASMCNKMLAVEPCCEEAHRRLMRCYSREGQHYLALRQYHLCVERLKEELDMAPTSTTTSLYEQIRKGKRI